MAAGGGVWRWIGAWGLGCGLLWGLAAPGAMADPLGQIYGFGDSRIDVGANGERYTSLGKLWIEYIGDALGRKVTPGRYAFIDESGVAHFFAAGGNDYAVGGASTGVFPGYIDLGMQIDNFAADHAGFARNDLVFLWTGENDIAAAGRDALDPTAYRPNDVGAFVAQYRANLDRLHRLGARNIVSFGVPVGLAPVQAVVDAFTAGGYPASVGEAFLAARAAQVAAQERAAWPMLRAEGVYVLDFNRLAEDVRLHLGKYGFLYGTDNYQGRGDPDAGSHPQTYPNDGNVFSANPPHFSDAMHLVISDFTFAQLRAREQAASLLAALPAIAGPAMAADNAGGVIEALGVDAAGADPRWAVDVYGGAEGGFGDLAMPGAPAGSGRRDGAGGVLGVVGHGAAHSVIGAEIAIGDVHGEFGAGSGGYDGTRYRLSLYGRRAIGWGVFADGQAAWSHLHFSRIYRDTALGAVARGHAQGAAEGDVAALQLGLGRDFALGPVRLRAIGGVAYSHAERAGYAEADSTISLAYGAAAHDDAQGFARLHGEWALPQSRLTPLADIGIASRIAPGALVVSAGPNGGMVVDYETNDPRARTAIEAGLGLRWQISARTRLVVQAAGRFSTAGGRERQGTAAVRLVSGI